MTKISKPLCLYLMPVLSVFILTAFLSGCGQGDDPDSVYGGGGTVQTTSGSPIQHVFIIILENKDFSTTFGPDSPAPYLAKTLTPQGELLTQYYATGHLSNDNYISIVSGQAPNKANQADCATYSDFKVSGQKLGQYGQVVGTGCVYPASVKTIADQLAAAGLTWKGYMEDMGSDPARDGAVNCAHPKLGTKDSTFTAEPNDQYATRHNPFVYFHSIIDSPTCKKNDVPLSRLPIDLLHADTTPNYAFITPNLCNDAHDPVGSQTQCANGDPGGLATADRFLQKWVPLITASPAFQASGLLIITFDEAEFDGHGEEYKACCNELPGPNEQLGGQPGIQGHGGGRIGTLLLSTFVKPGSRNDTPFNHYSLLRTTEDIFGLKHLGYAQQSELQTFAEAGVYNAAQP
jgi:hypothetical protein